MEPPINDFNNSSNPNTPQTSNNIRFSRKASENSNISNLLNNNNNIFISNSQNNINFLDNPLNFNNKDFNEINFENIDLNDNNKYNINNNGNNFNFNTDINKQNNNNNFHDANNNNNNLNNNINNNSKNYSVVMDNSVNNYTREEVIHKCSNIFFNFSKLDNKEKQLFINITNIKKIFKTVNLIDEKSLRSSDIDILIKKINPNTNKFSEKNFLDLIVMVAARIYPKDYAKGPKNTVDNLISTFFEPFSKHIEDKEIDLAEALKMPYMHKSLDLLITKFVIDYKVIALLNNIFFAIKEIYKSYFTMETIASKNFAKIAENSQANLIEYCKDFEIMPFMLNQAQLAIYFDLIVKTDIKKITNMHLNPNANKNYENFIVEPKKDLGTVFTLSRFCTSLVHFSIFSFSKNNQLNLSNIIDAEKFLLFLEKLENSKGFQNFEKKSNRPHTNKLTLIPSKSVLKMINSSLLEAYDFFGEEQNFNLNNNNNNKNNKTENLSRTVINQSRNMVENEKILKDYNEKARNNEEVDLRCLLNITDEVYESLINSRFDSLRDLFLRYAKLGEKLNTARINLSAFMKFLRDCGVLQADKNHKVSTNNKMQLSLNLMKIAPSPGPLSKTPTKLSKPSTASFSKSPISSRTAIKNNIKDSKDSSHNLTRVQFGNINHIAASKQIKNSSFYGPGERKLNDSDVNIIYSVLMGPRHMDNTGKIKHYFDKNAGVSLGVNEGSKYAQFDKSHGPNAFNGKMDFNMFIKSFELIANKLFPELRLSNAMQKLFNEVKLLIKIFKSSMKI